MKHLYLLVSFFFIVSTSQSQCTLNLGPDYAMCALFGYELEPLTANMEIDGGVPPYTYAWETTMTFEGFDLVFTASDFLNDTTLANPEFIDTGFDSFDFTVYVTDSDGSTCSDEIRIVLCQESLILEDLIRNINQGDSVQIYPGNYSTCEPVSVVWSPDYNISDINAFSPIVWPDSSTVYTPSIVDSAGCVVNNPTPFVINVSPLGTHEFKDLSEYLELFPNPSKGIVNLKWEGNHEGVLRVYSITGMQIYSQIIQGELMEIDLGRVSKGMYFVQLEVDEGVATKKLVLK
jgi:hypothetical protein